MLGTLIVVGYNTRETQKLRREAQRQTELQLRPFVIFEPAEGKDFCVRNIGNGTALNVRVVPFELSSPIMAIFPRPVPFLSRGEARPLQERTTRVEDEVVDDDFQFEVLCPAREFVKAEAASFLERPTVTIEFENVNGQRYFVQESLLYGDIEIMDFGPVAPPTSNKVRSARQRLQLAWQQLQPTWQQLQSAWQQLQWRKKKRVSEAPTMDEQDWVDGR